VGSKSEKARRIRPESSRTEAATGLERSRHPHGGLKSALHLCSAAQDLLHPRHPTQPPPFLLSSAAGRPISGRCSSSSGLAQRSMGSLLLLLVELVVCLEDCNELADECLTLKLQRDAFGRFHVRPLCTRRLQTPLVLQVEIPAQARGANAAPVWLSRRRSLGDPRKGPRSPAPPSLLGYPLAATAIGRRRLGGSGQVGTR
jgi:hypothetical protein